MGERRRHDQQQLLHHPPPPSRMGGLKGAGEIVEVEGGHIVRSTGRKDRHSKVCTAKGPRDRRVRLAAHTAIQFYDVQDRLGYDRPSKAVDWLMQNAKAAIDELAELPPWHPTAVANTRRKSSNQEFLEQENAGRIEDSGDKSMLVGEPIISSAYCFGGNGFLPASLDSDAIADTIKSFFPVTAAVTSSPSPSIGFQHYPPDLSSCTRSQAQDLRLSLQSFQDPILLQTHHHFTTTNYHRPSSPPSEQAFFSGSSTSLAFEATSASWSDHSHRMNRWSNAEANGGGGGYVFNLPQPPPQAVPLHAVLGQSQFFTQRGPLQSSNSSSIHAWTDPTSSDHQQAHAQSMASLSAIGFAAGRFSGFHIPARIQGEEEHDGISDKPSPVSRH